MEEARPQRLVFAVEVHRRSAGDWRVQAVTPSWFYGYHAADAAVQAFDRYMAHYRQTVADLVAPGAPALRILVRVQGADGRPVVFILRSVLEHKVRRDAGRRREALARLEEATEALQSSLRDAAAAGVRQADLARISGWSRETLRKLNRGERPEEAGQGS
ncbi:MULTISPECIES: hypothetical protein [unclassified Streptomyces]|uniref:hypothetical protein n=1 Tax=unclassified Streptomyces TaxID=2593676 RepID=UPI0029669858|nr:hypothetical protein [Streptomyces sp. SCL15-4]